MLKDIQQSIFNSILWDYMKRRTSDNEDIVNTYVLVIDTETSGLPGGRNVTRETYEKWNRARLVQVAWEFYNPAKECIKQEDYIVRPEGFEVPEVAANIHGITTERALTEGMPLIDVLKKLHVLLAYKPIIVAHNIQFDNDIILAELYRYQTELTASQIAAQLAGASQSQQTIINKSIAQIDDMIELWVKCRKHCTMLMGTLPGQKWPKLAVLYERCFNRLPTGDMHRADNDTRACAEIYFHLLVDQINGTSQ